ncbi:prepilin peptidase [Aestuariicella hydrocarbonica]|uniref:Protein translocase subunit SecA n=1 Tax=Pseudomaricurvus hydrocarbonicus TaxID=1470433 RepID=A0A9E5T1S9_9GAMM|nr:prepilin peptidase [Aestuariicella hydrocarbonica]NHO67800.1 prepilin peptidase [Aestuariicella hydrocarbonica]
MSDAPCVTEDRIRVPALITAFEKQWRKEGALELWLTRLEGLFLGWCRGRYLRDSFGLVSGSRSQQSAVASLSDHELRARTRTVGGQLRHAGLSDRESLTALLGLLSEVSVRSLGLKPHAVQLVGVRVLLDGHLAEMATGEGKTLVAGLAAAAAALCGMSVHVVTVNDYLAERDAAYVMPLMRFLRLSVGVVVQETSLEDRVRAYALPVCYCTNKELAFDYLRDASLNQRHKRLSRMAFSRFQAGQSATRRVQSLGFAIVDEADSILIDEARTPLILSAGVEANLDAEVIRQIMRYAQTLQEGHHYRINKLQSLIVLLEPGRQALHERFAAVSAGPLFLEVLREELLLQALSALYLYHVDQHYLIVDDKVSMIDEYTGRVMPDRVWSEGLHQMIEFKEGCPLSDPQRTMARMTYQRFFRRYQKLAGMTGTAAEVSGEFWNVYGLQVHSVPTHKPCARVVLKDKVFLTKALKWQYLVQRVQAIHETQAPVLIGVRSVSAIKEVAGQLTQAGLEFETLHAADDQREAEIIVSAGELGKITVATNMAGRGTDIALGQGVAAVGGLHVIMTARHDSGRIDRQLMGRCARQGNPGCFQTLQSLEDDLALVVRPSFFLTCAQSRLKKSKDTAAGWILAWGQKKLEQEHSRARERLLKNDHSESELLAFSGHPE